MDNIINKLLEQYYDSKVSKEDLKKRLNKIDKSVLIEFILDV